MKNISISTMMNKFGRQIHKMLKNQEWEVDITDSQVAVLMYIAQQCKKEIPVFQKDIEREFNIKGSSVTSVLNGLEKNKWISREKVDYDANNFYSYSETGIETVCDDFLNKVISNNIGEIWIVSSLFISNDRTQLSRDYDIPIQSVDRFLNGLRKHQVVREIDFDSIAQIFAPETQKYADKFQKLETEFHCTYPGRFADFKEILLSCFRAVGLYGHIFFVLGKSNLIAYPHTDDLGFGFIGMDKKILPVQKEYLKNEFASTGMEFISWN